MNKFDFLKVIQFLGIYPIIEYDFVKIFIYLRESERTHKLGEG